MAVAGRLQLTLAILKPDLLARSVAAKVYTAHCVLSDIHVVNMHMYVLHS